MFSLTLRTKPEAKLPKAARHSCGDSLVQVLPVRGWYRGPAALAAASIQVVHVVPGTNGRAILDCFENGIETELQNPGALS
jgi:hypothetical protein